MQTSRAMAVAVVWMAACKPGAAEPTSDTSTGEAQSESTIGVTTAPTEAGETGGTSGTSGTTGSEATSQGDTTSGSSGAAGTTMGMTSEESGSEGETSSGGETGMNGAECFANEDCETLACEKFRDLAMGTCEAGPGGGNTRFVGTIVDLVSLQPLPGRELRVLAILTALQNPGNGSALVMTLSDAGGEFDVTSMEPVAAAIGVVGVVQGGGYFTTVTGIAAPNQGIDYGPMNAGRDIWGVPAANLTEWSGLLANDPDFMNPNQVLPLGDQGGVIGLVRDPATGLGVAGEKVVGDDHQTMATIRYLDEDGLGFNDVATASSGLFVLVEPGLAEVFTVEGGGSAGQAGSALDSVFTLVLTVD